MDRAHLPVSGGILSFRIVGVRKLFFFLMVPGISGCSAPHSATPALATSGHRDFDAFLTHVLQEQVNGTDSGSQQDQGNDDGEHGDGVISESKSLSYLSNWFSHSCYRRPTSADFCGLVVVFRH
jgi:hypothetical protein